MNFWLTVVQDTLTGKNQDYVELAQACADVCQELYQRLRGRWWKEFSQSVFRAIEHLTT